MDEEKTRSELRDNFPGIGEEAIVQCMSLCRMFNKTPEDLKYKWEAMIYNTSVKDQPIAFFTVNSARDLQQLLQREVGKTGQAKVAAKKATGARKIIRNTVLGPSAGFSTPSATRRRMVDVKVEPATPSLRTNAQAPTGLPVNFSPPQNQESYSYRYMHEKIHDRAAILDEQIDNIAELVRQHYKLEELSDPSAGTPDEVVVVGRIVNDGDTKLGESSALLESSRMMGTGARVPLEFNADLKIRCASTRGTGSTGIGLFPGMIVALKGKNGSGDSFVVSEILRIPPLPSNSKSEDNVSLKAIVACGPFTFDSDLDYKPFAAIIETARNEQPDLLLLLGPFVSSNHPLIKIGHIDMTPASLFRERISKPLVQLEADAPETVVVIVPSPHDLITSHLVLPQSAIERDPELGLPRRCQLVPNPSIFSVNGFSIGAISVDVLFHIRKDLFSKQAQEISDEPSREPADPMSMLCRQILEQQSFYPLFPVPKEVQEDVNLSVVHSDLLKIKEVAPDILILPSKLKEFHKVVDSTLVINPALAAKFNSAGSAAWLSVTRSAGAAPQHNMKIVKLGT